MSYHPEENQRKLRCTLCMKCRQLAINPGDSEICSDLSDKDVDEKCTSWLETCSLTDGGDSVCCSETSDSCVSKTTTDDCSSSCGDITENELRIANKIVGNYGQVEINDFSAFKAAKNNYRNVTITKSKNIHLGNVTYINGPVYVNQSATTVNKHTTINQLILNDLDDVQPPRIVDRKNWLAQPPLAEREYLKRPAQLVIICHSATEEGYTQPDNILLVRLIQQFHIESRKWSDIAYHYLIGADGNIYEGRGWGVRGAHTYGYNENSMAIAFVGCYMKHLPPAISLEKAKQLIEYGIRIGAIDQDYQLLGHSQCSTTESPGSKLYEEIKTWKNWNPDVNINNRSPLAKLL